MPEEQSQNSPAVGVEGYGSLDVLADIAILMLVFATLATAWSWLGAYAGIISYGQALFFGIGGYAVAVSNLRGGSPWYGALGGALFAILAGVVFGVLCLRGRGLLFAILTLIGGALAEPFVAAHNWLAPQSAYVFPHRLGFLHLQFGQKWPYVLLALMVFATAQALTFGLRSNRVGYYLRALRTNFAAARAVGVNALPPRLLVIVASAFVTSVAGSFFAQYTLAVSPHAMFGLWLSLDIALVGVIAGSLTPWGAPLAGALYALVARAIPLHPAGTAGIVVAIVEILLIAVIALFGAQGILRGVLRGSPRKATIGVA